MQTFHTKQNLNNNIESTIKNFLEAAGEAHSFHASLPNLCIYFRELVRWNSRMNLTGIKQVDRMVAKHLGDTMVLALWLPSSVVSLLDIGTGAGIPGLILKILCPDLEVWLLDARRKRVSFLNAVMAEMELPGVYAVHGRAGTGGDPAIPGMPGQYDMVTSQALGSLTDFSCMTLDLLKPGGMAVSMKGPGGREELDRVLPELHARGWMANVIPATTPVEKQPRFLVVMQRSILHHTL